MAQRKRSEIKKALSNKGFIKKTKSSDHEYYILTFEGKKTPIFTKISRGSKYKDYSQSLLSLMSKQLKLSNSQLLALIDCTMTHENYLAVLNEKGINI